MCYRLMSTVVIKSGEVGQRTNDAVYIEEFTSSIQRREYTVDEFGSSVVMVINIVIQWFDGK